jgi:DNA-binding PadR family transcriptional regulator
MLYAPYMEYKINNAEFIILLLILEIPKANGYRLRNLVSDRGMEAWAGVSSSSIYVMVKKLENRGFITSSDDLEKQTKGPRGKVFMILPKGKAALFSAIEHGLAKCREHDQRFNIALSGMAFLGDQRTIECLQRRSKFLGDEQMRLLKAAELQSNLPLAAELLFGRINAGIESEMHWLETAINRIADEGNINVQRS